jgi:hypothetical protein
MRRILLSCAILGVLTLPAATASAGANATGKPGFLVVRNAANNGGVNGAPVVTIVMRQGFVLGSVGKKDEARVDVYQLGGQSAPAAAGSEPPKAVRWHHLPGREFNGTGFRFRAIGGFYRVEVRGFGVYLFAGGHGNVKFHGEGTYSIDDGTFRSLPGRVLTRRIGQG